MNTNSNEELLTDVRIAEILNQERTIMKRKQILALYPIQYLQKENRYWVRYKGRLLRSKDKEILENRLFELVNSDEVCNTRTLNNIFDEYLKARKMSVKATTWKDDIRYFKDFLSKTSVAVIPLEKITFQDCNTFYHECRAIKREMTKKYWNNLVGLPKNMMNYAIKCGYISQNPFVNIMVDEELFTPPRKKQDSAYIFTDDEIPVITKIAEDSAKAKKTGIPLGISFLFETGLRVGELCALCWKDIEVINDVPYVHVQNMIKAKIEDDGKAHGCFVVSHVKSDAGDRRIALNDKALSLLNEIHKYNEKNHFSTSPDDFIFLRKVKGNQTFCTARCFDSRLRNYCKKAGMSEIKSTHDIRRTVITRLYCCGCAISDIKEIAGHSTEAQTRAYIRAKKDIGESRTYMQLLTVDNSII